MKPRRGHRLRRPRRFQAAIPTRRRPATKGRRASTRRWTRRLDRDGNFGRRRYRLAANVVRHCEWSLPATRRSTCVDTGFGRLGAPRPTLSRVTTNDGRSPGSRVTAFDRLPRERAPVADWSSARRLQLRDRRQSLLDRIPILIPYREPSRRSHRSSSVMSSFSLLWAPRRVGMSCERERRGGDHVG